MKYYLSIQNNKIMSYLDPMDERYEQMVNSIAINFYSLVDLTEEQFNDIKNGVAYDFINNVVCKHEPTLEEQLQDLENAKKRKVEEISTYDQSEAVNQFIVNSVPMWLDKQTRSSLQYTIEVEEAAGKEVTKLWYEAVPPISFDIPISQLKQMLAALEQYAKDTYDTTQSHKAAVFALETKGEVINYDYQAGYPEKLVFTL